MSSLSDLLDYAYGSASGANRSVLGVADTLIGNPAAGLLNSVAGASIPRNPLLRLAQGRGVGRDAKNRRQAQGQAVAGGLGDLAIGFAPGVGDVAGFAQDVAALRSGEMTASPLTLSLTAAGLLPFIPSAGNALQRQTSATAYDPPGSPQRAFADDSPQIGGDTAPPDGSVRVPLIPSSIAARAPVDLIRPGHKLEPGRPYVTDSPPIKKVVYHGAGDKDVDAIKLSMGGTSTKLIDAQHATFATTNPQYAHSYTNRKQKNPGVVAVQVDLRNPALVDGSSGLPSFDKLDFMFRNLKESGYDGVVITNVASPEGPMDFYASFKDMPVLKE